VSLPVRTTPEAADQIRAIDGWWRIVLRRQIFLPPNLRRRLSLLATPPIWGVSIDARLWRVPVDYF